MATTNIKRLAADLLANYLSTSIPGLTGKVSAVTAGPEVTLPCLAVRIIPDSLTFEPTNADELYFDDVTDDQKLVLDVGQWTGRFTIELYANNPPERERYEQAIIDLFTATEWAPGTLYLDTPTLTIMNYVSLYAAQLKIRLEEETWMDEMAFESKRYSFLEVSVDLPALVTATAPTIDSLQLWLTENTIEDIIVVTP